MGTPEEVVSKIKGEYQEKLSELSDLQVLLTPTEVAAAIEKSLETFNHQVAFVKVNGRFLEFLLTKKDQ